MLFKIAVAIFEFALFTPIQSTDADESFSNNINHQSWTAALLRCIILFALSIFGICGCLISIIIFSHKSMRSSINVLLVGLSIVDLALIILAVLTFGINDNLFVVIYNAAESDDNTKRHAFECRFNFSTHNDYHSIVPQWTSYYTALLTVTAYPLAMIAQTTSVWVMVAITAERFIVVRHPLTARQKCTARRAKVTLLVIIISAFAYNAIRFREYRLDLTDQDCDDKLYQENLRNDNFYFVYYYVASYLICIFTIPFSTLAVLNSYIAYAVNKARNQRKHMTRQMQAEHRTAIMMLVIITVFFVCNFLPFLLNLLEACDRSMFSNSSTMSTAFIWLDISNILVVFNSATSCIVYYSFSRRYRALCKFLICKNRRAVDRTLVLESIVAAALIPIKSTDINFTKLKPENFKLPLSSMQNRNEQYQTMYHRCPNSFTKSIRSNTSKTSLNSICSDSSKRFLQPHFSSDFFINHERKTINNPSPSNSFIQMHNSATTFTLSLPLPQQSTSQQ